MNKDKYCMLSSCCKLVTGAKRCVIVDYDRAQLYFISHEYFTLLKSMNRKKIEDTERKIDDASAVLFKEFLSTMLKYEIVFLTENPECFPEISEEDTIDDNILLRNAIIEIDPLLYNREQFKTLCIDLNDLRCKEVQIRFLSEFSLDILTEIVNIISATNANYLEIHCFYVEDISIDSLRHFIESHAIVYNLYIYGAPTVEIVEVINDIPEHFPIPLGNIFFINYPFNDGNCCGIITQETLDYNDVYLHNQLKKRNGCLDKKITIDRFGNIKNCPSMRNQYGNVSNVSIKAIIQNEEFKKFWFIHKDQIDICRVCEFRYNCTDCRAFLQDPNDIYSKPLKCGYDPYTNRWEEWSVSPLKDKGVFIS